MTDSKDRYDIWDSFQDPEINRWSFQNVEKFASIDRIHKSNSTYHIAKDLIDLERFTFPVGENSIYGFDQAFEYLRTDGVIIIKAGEILCEKYFHNMKPQTPHLLFSVSKLYVGALIRILIARRLIFSEDDLVLNYLPELANTALSDVSVRHLLDMQTGLEIRDIGDVRIMESACGFAPPQKDNNIPRILQRLKNKKFPAGKRFEYLSLNTDILSLLITTVTGISAAQCIEKFIFEPIGAEFNGTCIKDPVGVCTLSGGLSITLRDLTRFGLLLLNDGYLNNSRILPAGYIDNILSTSEAKKWQSSWLAKMTPQASAYRSHIYVGSDKFCKGSLFGVGNFGNILFISPSDEVVISVLSSYPVAVDINRFTTLMAMVQSLSKI